MKKTKRVVLAFLVLPLLLSVLFIAVIGGSATSDAENFSSSAGGLTITLKELATKAKISEEKAKNVIDIASYFLSKERFTIQGTSGALAVAERESGFDLKLSMIAVVLRVSSNGRVGLITSTVIVGQMLKVERFQWKSS